MPESSTVLFRARVPAARLRKVERILDRLGMKPGDALNMLLAQIELRKALPFDVATQPLPLLSAEKLGEAWDKALGPY